MSGASDYWNAFLHLLKDRLVVLVSAISSSPFGDKHPIHVVHWLLLWLGRV